MESKGEVDSECSASMVLGAAKQAGLADGEQVGHQPVADRVPEPPPTVLRCHGHPAQLDPAFTLLTHGCCDWRAGLFVYGEDHGIADQARTEFSPAPLRHLEADGALDTPKRLLVDADGEAVPVLHPLGEGGLAADGPTQCQGLGSLCGHHGRLSTTDSGLNSSMHWLACLALCAFQCVPQELS